MINFLCFAQVPPPQMSFDDLSFKDAFWTNESASKPCSFTYASSQGNGSYTNTPAHIFDQVALRERWKNHSQLEKSTIRPTLNLAASSLFDCWRDMKSKIKSFTPWRNAGLFRLRLAALPRTEEVKIIAILSGTNILALHGLL